MLNYVILRRRPQAACARYSILSNLADIGLMYFLLPAFGVEGYFLSFALTHALNFGLGLRRLLRISGLRIEEVIFDEEKPPVFANATDS